MKSARKVLSLFLCMLLVLTAFAACSQAPAETPSGDPSSSAPPSSQSSASTASQGDKEVDFDTIPLKVIAPITGDQAQYGKIYKDTIDILVNERNAEGGIHGAEITVEYFDDKNDPKESVSCANLILSQEDTFAVIGTFSSTCALAAGPLFQQAGVVFLAPAPSHEDFTKIGDYMFRGVVTQPIQNEQYAKYIWDLGGRNLAILYSNDDVGVTSNEQVGENFTALGGKVVASESFIKGTTRDFSPFLTKFKQANADHIYCYGQYSDAAMIINQARSLDITCKITCQGSIIQKEFYELAGDNAEGITTMAMFSSDYQGEKYQRFLEVYPDVMTTQAAAAYDLTSILFDAIEDLGTLDPEAIKNWIHDLDSYEGLCGEFAFKDGTPQKQLFRMICKDGQFVLDTETPQS